MAGASLASAATILYILPSPVSGFAGFLNLAAIFLMYSTFRDLSWVFHDQSIYRNLVIGSVVATIFAIVAEAYITYSAVTNPTGVSPTEYYALIVVAYPASLVYTFFLLRGLNLVTKASGIVQFRLSAITFVFSTLIPVFQGSLS